MKRERESFFACKLATLVARHLRFTSIERHDLSLNRHICFNRSSARPQVSISSLIQLTPSLTISHSLPLPGAAWPTTSDRPLASESLIIGNICTTRARERERERGKLVGVAAEWPLTNATRIYSKRIHLFE